ELLNKMDTFELSERFMFATRASKIIRAGLVRQITSFPVDLRVESEIDKTLPEHRGEQEKYLKKQVADLTVTLDPSLQNTIPEKSYRDSTAMNIAFAENLGKLG